jgi:trehalose synthase (EC:5.4.99.16)
MTLPVPASPDRGAGLPARGSDPLWFKRAVFYEVLVRGFADSNADGVGDLRGMIDKLDYLQWLGVDCLWLPPFFASPLRDGGTTSATTPPCCPSSATSTTSPSSSPRPTPAASA